MYAYRRYKNSKFDIHILLITLVLKEPSLVV